MCQPFQETESVLCPQCDLLVELPALAEGEKACCPRCHATLTTHWRLPRWRLNSYSLAALFMLLLASLFPFVSMQVSGIHSQISLLTISQVMFAENYLILGVLFLLLVILMPGISLLIILLLINPLSLTRRVKIRLARLLFCLKSWGMPEIFIAGVLVSFVKLLAYGDIGIGVSFLPMCLFCLLQLRVFQCLDRRWLWQLIAPVPPPGQKLSIGVTGIHQGLRLCGCCHGVVPVKKLRCPRCHSKGYVRRKHSLQWTMALLLTAIMLYLPANILPMMNTEFLGSKASATILSGVMLLWKEGAYPVALVIFIASIIVPGLKMIAIGWLCCDAKGYSRLHGSAMHLVYEIVEFVGRWSMIDVFVIAVLSALVRTGALMSIYPATGSLVFALVVIITMFAVLTFDPRLCWDRATVQHSGEQRKHD